MTLVALCALGLLIGGLLVAVPELFNDRYLWERLTRMRAEVNLHTGEIVTDYERLYREDKH